MGSRSRIVDRIELIISLFTPAAWKYELERKTHNLRLFQPAVTLHRRFGMHSISGKLRNLRPLAHAYAICAAFGDKLMAALQNGAKNMAVS